MLGRRPDVLAQDTVYAAVGVTSDVLSTVVALPARAQAVVTEAPVRLRGAAAETPERVKAAWDRVETAFDRRVSDGRTIVRDIKRRAAVKRALEQASHSRARIRGAVSSVLRTGEVAVGVGRQQARKATRNATGVVLDQAKVARSQVKGAATSIVKTADVAVEAATVAASELVS